MALARFSSLPKMLRRIPAFYPTTDTTAAQRRGMKMLWWNNIIASLSGSLYGDFVVLYMLALGASASSVGLRSSINSAAALAAPLLGAWLVERTHKRKFWVVLWPGGVSRSILLLLACLPFVFQGQIAVNVFVLLIAIQAFSDTLSGPAANSLFGDILPRPLRGRFIGAQMIASNIVRMATVPLAGWLIKSVGGISGYQLAWLLAALVGFCATSFYARIPEPATIEGQDQQGGALQGFIEGWRVFARDRRFVLFCAMEFIWNFGISLAGPFFQVHMVKDLGFGVDTIANLVMVTTPVNIIALRLAGELVDRKGALPVMRVSMLIVPFLPIVWIFARVPWHVALVQCYGFISWAGYHVAVTPLILTITPPAYRSRYIAILNTINSVAAILAPLIAGWVYTNWGFTANGILSGVGRGLGGLLFLILSRFFDFTTPYQEEAPTMVKPARA